MSGRYRAVALQAIGVAVLAAVIFVAFLRPSDPGDLSGIDAPAGNEEPEIVIQDPQDDPKRSDGRKRGNKANNGRDRSRQRGGSRARGGQSSGSLGPLAVFLPPDTDGSGGDGPGDEQYTDLVSRLMEQVGAPNLFREIDNP